VAQTPVLALPDAGIAPARLRAAAAAGQPVPDHVVRVFPGEAVPLEFVDGGVSLPGESTATLRSTEASPAPGPPSP